MGSLTLGLGAFINYRGKGFLTVSKASGLSWIGGSRLQTQKKTSENPVPSILPGSACSKYQSKEYLPKTVIIVMVMRIMRVLMVNMTVMTIILIIVLT